jgi:hypothetical protein
VPKWGVLWNPDLTSITLISGESCQRFPDRAEGFLRHRVLPRGRPVHPPQPGVNATKLLFSLSLMLRTNKPVLLPGKAFSALPSVSE